MKCRLCGDPVEYEGADFIETHNPETFRNGIMHWWCFDEAYHQLEFQEASARIYANRKDEYEMKFF